MTNFCPNCGKKLEGKPCDCVKIIEPDINNIANEIKELLKNMFLKPIDTIKKNIKKEKFDISLILVIIMSLMAGLFCTAALKNSYELIFTSDSISNTSTINSSYENIPYAQTFFTVIIVVFALSFIFPSILHLVNTKIFKGKSSFKEVFNLFAINSIILSVSLLISAIFTFILPTFAIIILLLGLILNTVYMIMSIKFIGPKDENKYGYLSLVTTVIFYFVILIIDRIFS